MSQLLTTGGGGGGGVTSLNTLTGDITIATGTTGSDFNVSASGATVTLNLPTASASVRGALSTSDWSTFNAKVGGSGTSGKLVRWTGTSTVGNSNISESSTGALTWAPTSTTGNLWNADYSGSTTTSTLWLDTATINSGGAYFKLANVTMAGTGAQIASRIAGSLSVSHTDTYAVGRYTDMNGSVTLGTLTPWSVGTKGLIGTLSGANNTSTTGASYGHYSYASGGLINVGGFFEAIDAGTGGTAANRRTYGVRGFASQDNSAKAMGGLFVIGTTSATSSAEGFNPEVSAGLVAANGNTTDPVQRWYDGSTEVARLRGGGRLTVGIPDESAGTFFTNESTGFLANGLITGLGDSVPTIIRIGAESVFEVSPSADTNTSTIGAVLYSAHGFNLTLKGSNKFNAGIAVGGITDSVSAIGAFGQVSVDSDDTVDGAIGLLCTSSHRGGGSATALLVGGAFSVNTGPDAGTSGSLTTAIGGHFTVDTEGGVNITNGIGAQFTEPYILTGSATITNKTAMYCKGTFSDELTTDSSTTGTVNAYDVLTGWVKFTASTTLTINGLANGYLGKNVVFYNRTGNDMTVNHLSGSASSGNKVRTATAGAITIADGKKAWYRYDPNSTEWILMWPEA